MIRNITFLFFLLTAYTQGAFSQTDSLGRNWSPYKTSLKVDGPAIAVGIGLNVLGFKLIQNKEGLTESELAQMSKNDVPAFDRFSAGDYSENADKLSYYPFYASFAMPVALLLNRNVGSKAGQVMALYLETMAVTGAMYTITAGAVNRSRPFTYGTAAPLGERTKKGAQRSFFAGHTAATASATFFAAKVFSDFNPESKAKPYVWAAAALVPATVGYYRLRAGMHFLSDNLIGYAVGAGAGILVPHLHKKANNNLSVVPFGGASYSGLQLSYTF
ncbi:phosphatase PAP2 family protein [Pedobacter sp. SYSU D00535]|uniref:phosphatase PAP2 family protein n=1 Tax=Pedobacter sp. SYSU D00535 TaxID=2810308 RepID=UPI001A9611B4|nr:phosphatase PAP2 family protein [Pedobacter sp. SYSU D00535]